MSLVNENSPVTALQELDFFSRVPVQTSIESTYVEEIRPLAQLNTGAHIEFIINNNYNEYVRLNDITLYLKFKVNLAKASGNLVDDDWDKVSLVNNFLHSLWQQVDLFIGNNQVTTALQTYPYKAYFETILGSTPHSRKTYLSTQYFFEEGLDDDESKINSERSKLIKKGNICEIEGRLHLDMFMQPKALIGGTKMRVRLISNRPEFYFMCSDSTLTPSIHFEDIHLNVTKLRISEEVVLAQLQALSVSPAKYIVCRGEVRTITIDKDKKSVNLENVVNGQMPRRVYLAFISNDAYSGNFTKNPLYFEHYKINSINAFVNGQQILRKAYTPNFDSDLYAREYNELFRISGQYDNDSKMSIEQKNFKKGSTIFAFDLTPDHMHGNNSYVNITQSGILRFEINFKDSLTTTLNAMIYCEYDNQVSISQDREAQIDYH